jgi:hypothetical protein
LLLATPQYYPPLVPCLATQLDRYKQTQGLEKPGRDWPATASAHQDRTSPPMLRDQIYIVRGTYLVKNRSKDQEQEKKKRKFESSYRRPLDSR